MGVAGPALSYGHGGARTLAAAHRAVAIAARGDNLPCASYLAQAAAGRRRPIAEADEDAKRERNHDEDCPPITAAVFDFRNASSGPGTRIRRPYSSRWH